MLQAFNLIIVARTFYIKTKNVTLKIFLANCLYKVKMLYFHRIDISHCIDANKINALKKCNLYHYWYFLDKGFTFQLNACNGCHDFLMVSLSLNYIAALKIHGVDYCCRIHGIDKCEAIKSTSNTDLTHERGVL